MVSVGSSWVLKIGSVNNFCCTRKLANLVCTMSGGGHNGPPVLTNPGDVPVFFFVFGNISKPGTSNIFSNNKRNRKRRMIAIDE